MQGKQIIFFPKENVSLAQIQTLFAVNVINVRLSEIQVLFNGVYTDSDRYRNRDR